MDKQTIVIEYLDNVVREYKGDVKILQCGVIEITTVEAKSSSSLIASLNAKKVVGIPLSHVRSYTIS